MLSTWDWDIWKSRLSRSATSADYEVIEFTKDIYGHSQASWEAFLCRGKYLAQLGYVELAAGDIHKALIQLWEIEADSQLATKLKNKLVEDGHCIDGANPSTMVHGYWQYMKRSQITAYESLTNCLDRMTDWYSMEGLCRVAMQKIPSAKILEQRRRAAERAFAKKKKEVQARNYPPTMAGYTYTTGTIFLTAYPFVPQRFGERDTVVIRSAKEAFSIVSTNCTLSTSPVGDHSDTPSDVYGVFASRYIDRGSLLLEDFTVVAATSCNVSAPCTLRDRFVCDNCCGMIPRGWNRKSFAPCCGAMYCNEYCRTMALATYHRVLCRQDFEWLFKDVEHSNDEYISNLNGPLWLRILAICIQSDCHPLEQPIFATLSSLQDNDTPRRWSYLGSLAHPIKILQQLGVDVFSDPRFDTWVLHTLWGRITTNQRIIKTPDGRCVRAVNPLYSFFNHSCVPNAICADIQRRECIDETTMRLYAARDVEKGEEICITYFEFNGMETKAQRQKALYNWIGVNGQCRCKKCRM
ncbi:MAG: hypothetical protein Q9169_000717 [Polycauliona sp. 2 TL-2023]